MRAAYVVAYSQEREKRVERGREQKQDLKKTNEPQRKSFLSARPFASLSPACLWHPGSELDILDIHYDEGRTMVKAYSPSLQ